NDADPMPGRITGELIVHGEAKDLASIYGDGHLEIADSDLGKVDVLEFLYNRLSAKQQGPSGAGRLDLTLERSVLTLNHIRYFNRGVEAWSSNMTIRDIWNVPNSPIEGYVVGSARPLAGLKLPLIADVDQIMREVVPYVSPTPVV